MEDRRRENRKKLMAFTLVYEAQQGRLLGYLSDLTMQGAMVIGEKPMSVNTLVTLRIKFPGDLPGVAATELVIPVRVARCVQDESPTDYMLGCEFVNISPQQTEIIQALLERYHFQHQIKTTRQE